MGCHRAWRVCRTCRGPAHAKCRRWQRSQSSRSPCQPCAAAGAVSLRKPAKRRKLLRVKENSSHGRTKNARCASTASTLHLKCGETAASRERAVNAFSPSEKGFHTSPHPVCVCPNRRYALRERNIPKAVRTCVLRNINTLYIVKLGKGFQQLELRYGLRLPRRSSKFRGIDAKSNELSH